MNECIYCDIDSGYCEYFVDPLDGTWYQKIETGEWDNYNDDFVTERIYGVKYCTWCGRKLGD